MLQRTEPSTVITESENVELLLQPYRDLIGDDYAGYRGHIYRVLNYALFFLDGPDSPHRNAIEVALVYHDIGLWTDKELAYLEPSIERMSEDGVAETCGCDPQLLYDIISEHHKIRPFRGPNAKVVNAVRKADWIDASGARLQKGLPDEVLAAVTDAIPANGFYETLKRIGPELSGGKKLQMVRQYMRVFKL